MKNCLSIGHGVEPHRWFLMDCKSLIPLDYYKPKEWELLGQLPIPHIILFTPDDLRSGKSIRCPFHSKDTNFNPSFHGSMEKYATWPEWLLSKLLSAKFKTWKAILLPTWSFFLPPFVCHAILYLIEQLPIWAYFLLPFVFQAFLHWAIANLLFL